MPKQVKKLFGENPEKVHVLDTSVEFDENGEADVEDHVAEVFAQIPGYEVAGEAEGTSEGDKEPEDDDNEDGSSEDDNEDDNEDEDDSSEDKEEEAPAKPKRPARKTPARK